MKKTNVVVVITIVVCLIIFFLWYNSPDQKARRNVEEIKKTFERLVE